jgi:lipid IVA palmitoyltransferase
VRPFLIRVAAALAAVAACAGGPAFAQTDSVCDRALLSWVKSNCEGARDAWRGEDYDVYLFGHAHHGRSTYTAQRIRELNERAWGSGVGKQHLDAKGNTHLIYAVAFQDSHFKAEYMVGYGWLTYWRPLEGSGLRLGLGFTAFVTTRSDYARYLAPVPGILPMGEVAWRRVSLMATYVPRLSGNEGNGDVLMIFGKIAF